MFSKILLAVDGSNCALDAAGNLARSENSKQLRILTVTTASPTIF